MDQGPKEDALERSRVGTPVQYRCPKPKCSNVGSVTKIKGDPRAKLQAGFSRENRGCGSMLVCNRCNTAFSQK